MISKTARCNMKPTGTQGRKASRRRYTAAEKCRSVLALWTERSSGAELCKQLGVTWSQLSQWQEQAMEGMLLGLEPKSRGPNGNTPLSVRLQALLARQSARAALVATQPPGPAPIPPKPLKSCRPSPLMPPSPQIPATGAASAPVRP